MKFVNFEFVLDRNLTVNTFAHICHHLSISYPVKTKQKKYTSTVTGSHLHFNICAKFAQKLCTS